MTGETPCPYSACSQWPPYVITKTLFRGPGLLSLLVRPHTSAFLLSIWDTLNRSSDQWLESCYSRRMGVPIQTLPWPDK